MKKLILLLLIVPVLVIAQEQEYFVNGVNIKDIKSEFIRIDHYGDASKKKVYINFLGDEQCPKMSSFPNCLLLKDKDGKDVKFKSTITILNMFADYDLKVLDLSENRFFLQRKSSK